MLSIARYDLTIGTNEIRVFPGRVVHVASVREVARLWIVYAIGVPKEEWRVVLVGTGADVPDGGEYLGTAIDSGGELHAFRVA